MLKFIIVIHKQSCFVWIPFVPPTHNDKNPEAVNLTCFVSYCGLVLWLMGCPVFQGRDELGNHTGGPSEKDHEQHTDYESPDAASPWHGCSSVTGCDGMPRAGARTITELIWNSAWDVTGIIVKVNGHLSCLTLPAVSGVKSFLCSLVKDCTPLLQRALENGKGQKKNSNNKRNYLDETTFFFFFRSAYEPNHISNGALEGVWRLHFFNLINDLSAHHGYRFP